MAGFAHLADKHTRAIADKGNRFRQIQGRCVHRGQNVIGGRPNIRRAVDQRAIQIKYNNRHDAPRI